MREASNPLARIRAVGLALLGAAALSACADDSAVEPPIQSPSPDDQQEFLRVVETAEGPVVAGRVLVKFRNGEAPSRFQHRFGTQLLDLTDRIDAVRVAEGRELELAAELETDPAVEYAEPDYVYELYAAPNDTYWGYKWGLHNDGTLNTSAGGLVANTGAVDADIDWLEAYQHLAGASFQTVRIAILDSGIRQDHEDLASKVVGQYDFFDDDGDATDDNGHGSHTAGIAAAMGNNGVGVTGVAWHDQAKLLVAKICGPTGFGPFAAYGCPSSGTASAIRWAADNGARVINLSIGGPSGSSAQQDALAYALTQETLAFCSSGNDNGPVSYPAAFPECVAVGATDWSDNRASYSNYGPEVELSAPGGDDENASGYSYILSSYHDAANSYVFMAGTSMAAPMATGLGGLLASLGVATADEIRSIMASTADDLGPSGGDDQFGHGRINAHAAVQAVLDGGSGDDGGDGDGGDTNSAPVGSFIFSCTDLDCSFDASGSTDSDGIISAHAWDFGDGNTGSGQTASHSYAASGTYTVTLTVTDDSDATDTDSQDVTVTVPSSGEIHLSATGTKNRGRHVIALSWTGTTSSSVDIYRNGNIVATVGDTNSYSDSTGQRGGGSYTHKVCEAGTATCSDEVTTVF